MLLMSMSEDSMSKSFTDKLLYHYSCRAKCAADNATILSIAYHSQNR